ncbi:hypothetical protein NQ315_015854 [Exocentrus adspersus]|uniref:Transport and Golgi organization protein 6 homolog n=1 Tax=Exocentrus adspersus TaxID=1586481 RepID=A0AAV8W3I2_9CUCU|nr:hypothetical protein NQ315_015854 [Exocentrus adspersus]
MEKVKLVSLLSELNSGDSPGSHHLYRPSENKCQEIFQELSCSFEVMCAVLKSTAGLYFSKELTCDWKYVILNFYLLHLLNNELESHNDVLSVQQSKTVKTSIRNVVSVGILSKLQPNLPLYVPVKEQPEPRDIFLNYNILKCTSYGLCEFLKHPNLRLLILPDNLKAILVAVYQISYCPLKKPETGAIPEEVYSKLLEEKKLFIQLLRRLQETIHPGIIVRETMAVLYTSAPTWFKKSVSQTLTSIIRSGNGVEHIAVALLDGASNDSAQTWKVLEVFSKLILSCKDFPDFQSNICKQLSEMLDKVSDDTLVYERLYSHCTKSFFLADEDVAKNIFIRRIVQFFLHFTYKDHKFEDGEVLTEEIKQHTRLLHAVFVESTAQSPSLPVKFLTPVIYVIFRFYSLTLGTQFKTTNTELKEVLISYLEQSLNHFQILDSFLFEINSEVVLPFRNDVELKVDKGDVILKYSEHSVSCSVHENSERLLQLLENKTKLLVKLFGFLLNCLTDKDKYFRKANESLLNVESEFMTEFIERNLVVYKLLSDLAEDKNIPGHIAENPSDILKYIRDVCVKAVAGSVHKSSNFDSEAFQTLFTILMVLEMLVRNSSQANLKAFKVLSEPLEVIKTETRNEEVKDLVGRVLKVLETGNGKAKVVVAEVKSELDKAIEDVCDPMLPVRGHGLMTLMKLVEKKDKNVMERKQYVLNIFQQSLKNEDSFIYLSAIGGLAAMADVFPDTVLNILCEEYLDSSSKPSDDGHEIRMKLGESLVRVTKILGEMAPKYKPLLLNTFLAGARDEDHLIRASSLSNLGEICRVLGYKLGTIVTEVLVCVHATIATDKAPEPRRAAVTVLRQLLIGLESEMIAYLKDDILPIYRTLKEIYHNDKDEVMRLQAQLALEELNENMKSFVFPKLQLSTEKKIVMLD